MSAPVIGLSTYAEPARWAAWQAPAALLPTSYIDQVTEAGGVPVLLPPVPGIARALGRLDGLILTGGGDIDPAGYGAQADPRTSRVHPERDQAELELLAAALADGLPILGICRGMQLINVARGGTLDQDLAAEAGHRPAPGAFGSHPVRLAPGSQLTSILQPDGGRGGLTLDVPTAHHQGIARLGDGLVPVAWAQDGLILDRTAARARPAPLHDGGAVASRGGPGTAAGVRAGRGGGRRAGALGPGRPGCGSPLIGAVEHLHSPA
jgi:putative glutamine amidotransferase